MDRISILLADDHVMFRETLKQFLCSRPDLKIVGEAGTADETLQKALPLCPDVILLDITMPGESGIAILPQLQKRCPDSRILIVTVHEEPAYLRAALAVGAAGYVVKTSPSSVLLEAIHAVHQHKTFVDPSLRDLVNGRRKSVRSLGGAPLTRLSERERQVLLLLAQGLSYQAIADKIGISVKTVETYRSRLKAKLGFKSREDLMRLAFESGILSEGDLVVPPK